jgi:hypothetical protein
MMSADSLREGEQESGSRDATYASWYGLWQ